MAASWISQNDNADGTNDYKTLKNVGIGTDSPDYPLDVVGRSRIRGSGDGGGGLWLSKNSTPTANITFMGRGIDAEAFVGFYNDGGWGLVIKDSTRNVGIGTTNPNNKLDVAGTIQCNALRIDQTPGNSSQTPDKYFTIDLNGTEYYVPCFIPSK